jgi:hypothetical protein
VNGAPPTGPPTWRAGTHSSGAWPTPLAAADDLVLLKRATSSLYELDYAIAGPGDRLGQVELKAKHQPYRGWGHLRPDLPEAHLFILDELALRKIVDAGRYAYLVVADVPHGSLVCLVDPRPGTRHQDPHHPNPRRRLATA